MKIIRTLYQSLVWNFKKRFIPNCFILSIENHHLTNKNYKTEDHPIVLALRDKFDIPSFINVKASFNQLKIGDLEYQASSTYTLSRVKFQSLIQEVLAGNDVKYKVLYSIKKDVSKETFSVRN